VIVLIIIMFFPLFKLGSRITIQFTKFVLSRINMLRKVLQTLTLCLVASAMTAVNAQEAEKDAIRRVVMQETESYLNVDLETWKSTWLPVSYAYWSFSDKGGTQFIDGWEKIESTFTDYFTNQKPSRSKLTYTWQEIRVYGSGAYVRFKEKQVDNDLTEESNQIRVLEKKDGKWKIICMSAVVE